MSLLYYLFIIKNNDILYEKYDLSSISYFFRSTIENNLQTKCRELIKENMKTNSQEINKSIFKGYAFYTVFASDTNICTCIIVNEKYGEKQVKTLLHNLKYSNKDYNSLFLEYRNEPVDKIEQITKTLDEMKIIMNDNIEKIIKRGEDLDTLSVKASNLSDHAKIYKKKAHDYNKCCRFM